MTSVALFAIWWGGLLLVIGTLYCLRFAPARHT